MAKIQQFIKKRIGSTVHTFVVEGENLHEVVMTSQKLSFYDVPVCGVCGSDMLHLSAHVTKEEGHEYTTIRCNGCGSSLNFGQQKKDKDVYYLRTRDEVDVNGQPTGRKELDWRNKDGQPVMVQYGKSNN
jgi:DNA-directed RNA polymerase subunit RPC12/RpoP